MSNFLLYCFATSSVHLQYYKSKCLRSAVTVILFVLICYCRPKETVTSCQKVYNFLKNPDLGDLCAARMSPPPNGFVFVYNIANTGLFALPEFDYF